MPDTTRELRGIRLTGAVASTEVRYGTLLGVEYVVAPIVLLVGDSVIFPINADSPEFVPAEVLQVAPAGWNGRPAMAGDHPAEEGAMVSANIPLILEGHQFGQLFGVRFENNRLQGEAWINPERAAAVPDGLEILQRIKDGDPVEISVGAFVVVERLTGTANGRDYSTIWREITPDHVALLRQGLIGACSLDMGCGTPRAARHHVVDAEAGMRELTTAELTTLAAQALPAIGDRVEVVGPSQVAGHAAGVVRALQSGASGVGIEFDSKPGEVYNWYIPPQLRVTQRAAAQRGATEAEPAASEETVDVNAKLLQYYGSTEAQAAALAALQGMSDTELRDMLYEALKRVEPQCAGIISVTPDDKTVVYLVDPDPGGPMPLKPYMRTYAVGADNAITFSDERIPVRRREEWVPVAGYRSAAEQAAADAQAQQRGACSCGGHQRSAAGGAEGETMTKAERITALIANPRSPFEEADRAYLETLTDERIAAAEASAAEPEPQQRQHENAGAEETVTVSADELSSLRAMKAERDRTRAAQKRALVGKLKTAQTTYNEQRLNGMELEQLQEVAALLQLDAPQSTDFVALERDAEEPATAVEPPKPYSLAIAKRNGAAN